MALSKPSSPDPVYTPDSSETIEDLITNNYTLLRKRLKVEKLIPYFIERKLLDFPEDKQVVMSKTTAPGKAEALLELLTQKGTCTPEEFVEILKKGDHQHVADQLKRPSTHSKTTKGQSRAVQTDDVIDCLKDLYATEYAHVRPLPWCEDLNLHLEEVYTDLQLQQRDGRGRFQDTDTIAVTNQPMQWMAVPGAIPGCPPGLEYLTQLDQLLLQQQVELLEGFTGIETKNKYAVKNSMGQHVYFAYEESDFCSRLCCGAHRGFQFHVTDNNGQEVIRLNREFKCCAGGQWCASCCDCCAHEILVEAPVGQVVGVVRQVGSFWKPHYHIMNERREMVFDMWGPCCAWSGACCTCDVDFTAYGSDGHTEVGIVTRRYAGFAKETTNFFVIFPQDLDVKLKATMLGACLMADFMYFADQDKENDH